MDDAGNRNGAFGHFPSEKGDARFASVTPAMPTNPRLKTGAGLLIPSRQVGPPTQSAASITPASMLGQLHAVESARIRERFESSRDGRAALRERSDLVDEIVTRLYGDFFPLESHRPASFCLVALGGYGRQELFPHSDIDLLFLTEDGQTQASYRESIAVVLRTLWDLRLRVGHSTRTLADCGRLHRDNLEFNIALLDCRYLGGDPQLFVRLHDILLPHLLARDHQELLRNLAALTRRRHAKYSNTIFHLEPNAKEAPGGLRDYHVCRWATRIAELGHHGRWTDPEGLWPPQFHAEGREAFEFLTTTRCFLHYLCGRDDNQLSYESQEQAAARGLGQAAGNRLAPADWMRHYFRHARSVDRLTTRLLDEVVPARSGLYGLYQDWRSRLSNSDFAVVRGLLFIRQPAALDEDPELVLRLFEMVARHGLGLSREAERSLEEAIPRAAGRFTSLPGLWQSFHRILSLPYAAQALRAMHRQGLLTSMFPEFQPIDALVIRDFYHRYTVDEHSFLTIQNLHALSAARPGSEAARAPMPGPEWERRFAEILREVEQPELLFLALLFHDVGKGMQDVDHVVGSLKALETIMARLDLAPAERETVRFLITFHLEMSAVCQRRDVFDPETVRAFAEKVRTSERLKMLCLLTYADIRAVSPEALTPWKAELLWQLYAATANFLARSVDEERVQSTGPATAEIEPILTVLPVSTTTQELSSFLAGLPRRYLASHSPEEIASHFGLARRPGEDAVQVGLRTRNHHYELTVVTADRPYLFASITGTLAAWGMNILKAEAFANAAGVVLDTFRFVDLYRTLDLNPSERARFQVELTGRPEGQAGSPKTPARTDQSWHRSEEQDQGRYPGPLRRPTISLGGRFPLHASGAHRPGSARAALRSQLHACRPRLQH